MQKKILTLSLMIGMLTVLHGGLAFSSEQKMDAAGYVGAETCKDCHEGQYASYAQSIHSKAPAQGPGNKNSCESCHGPASRHVDGGGDTSAIFTFAGKKVEADAKAARCLSCHEDTSYVAFWDTSRHKAAGVSCDDCHSGHSNQPKNLKAAQSELCFSCHKDIRSQANRQSHHPIVEGKVSCSDCHDPHGGFGSKMIKADSVNDLCYSCHADKRGPFMWEHPPVEENCMTCHTAHGSNHTKLLTRKGPHLCQSCHDWTFHPSTSYAANGTFTNGTPVRQFVGRNCLNCHNNVHGSNGAPTQALRFVR